MRILQEKVAEVKGASAKDLHDKAERLKQKISKMRKRGLAREGEFSVENLAFKILRRNEYLGKLSSLRISAYDRMMSLNGE